MIELPSGIVTFVFTDIEGSTRLLHQLGHQEYSVLLDRHHRLLRSAFTTHDGVEVDTAGDGFFVAFARTSDAVAACLDAQLALIASSWPEGGEIRVRMGIHTGEAAPTDGRYVSIEVHQAARIAAVAHGGQVVISEVSQSLIRDHLPDGSDLWDLGAHRLKDFGTPQHLFQLCHPSLPKEFPPLRSLTVRRHNLPAPLTDFIGRHHELAELREILMGTRLLTLTGTGGAGKTRLGLQLAHNALGQYPDGAWLAELAPISDPALVPQQVASALQLRDEPGRPLVETIIDYLGSKNLLLILDNCEHLADASAALAATVMARCERVTILATSRQSLNVPGEHVWRVPSLPLPPAGALPPLEELVTYDAVGLFVARASLADRRFTLTEENAASVVDVLRHLDGIPLAIELATARLRLLSVGQLAARLGDRFRVLTGGSTTLLPRQRTLRALVDWSHDLLSEDEQVLLRRASLFAGDFSLSAAEDICSGGGLEPDEILDLLGQLVDKSLVLAETHDDAARYRMLETIRQYAGERLAENGEHGAFSDRYCQWYVELAQRAEAKLLGPEQAFWLDLLEKEHDNLRQVLRWTKDAGQVQTVYSIAAALWRFWWIRGHLGEGRSWLDGALSDVACAPAVRGRALHAAGALAWDQSDYRAARYFLSESIRLLRDVGDHVGVACAMYKLAAVFGLQGDNAQARCLLEETLQDGRRRNDAQAIGQSVLLLGQVAFQEGNVEEATEWWERSLAHFRDIGDTYAVTASLGCLAEAVLLSGRVEEAGRLVEDSLEMGRALGDKWRVARATHVLGEIAHQEGDLGKAAALQRKALRLRREIGLRDGIADSLEGLADVAASAHDWAQAARLLAAAHALRIEIGAPVAPGRAHQHAEVLERVRTELGEAPFARAWEESLHMSVDDVISQECGSGSDTRSVAA